MYRTRLPEHGCVAVKVFEDAGPQGREQARREASWLHLLEHPGIPFCHGSSVDGDVASITMELVDGVSLQVLGRHGRGHTEPLPCVLLAHVGAEVASVLEHCGTHSPAGHRQPLRLIHGDLKPSNLMLRADGSVVVLDFGVAVSANESDAVRRAQGGTVRYLSLQRLMGEPATLADDLYALGATLISLALGGAPVRAHVDPIRHAEHVDWMLDSLPAGCAPLEPLLRSLLSHDPTLRPGAREVEAALRPLCVPAADLARTVARLVRTTDGGSKAVASDVYAQPTVVLGVAPC